MKLNKVIQLIEKRELKQKDIARYLGMCDSQFSMILNGKRKLTYNTAYLLAVYFNTKTDELFNEDFLNYYLGKTSTDD